MDASNLISKARADGLSLRYDGQQLWVGPRDRLTAQHLDQLRRYKAQIIAYLAETPGAGADGLIAWVGRRVQFEHGSGRLVSVNRAWAGVAERQSAGPLTTVLPSEVLDPETKRPIVADNPWVH